MQERGRRRLGVLSYPRSKKGRSAAVLGHNRLQYDEPLRVREEWKQRHDGPREHPGSALDGGPVFFGHYWLTGAPLLQSPRHACVDYSAGDGGPLVAYRFNGEPTLSPEGFVWVS